MADFPKSQETLVLWLKRRLSNIFFYLCKLKAVYTCDFARCNCHRGVCNELMTVSAARYPLMIRCSLSSTVSSVKNILQDVNRKAQNRTCEQPLRSIVREFWCYHNFDWLQKRRSISDPAKLSSLIFRNRISLESRVIFRNNNFMRGEITSIQLKIPFNSHSCH